MSKNCLAKCVTGLLMFSMTAPAWADISVDYENPVSIASNPSSMGIVIAGISFSIAVVSGFFLKSGGRWAQRLFFGSVLCAMVVLISGLLTPNRPIYHDRPYNRPHWTTYNSTAPEIAPLPLPEPQD